MVRLIKSFSGGENMNSESDNKNAVLNNTDFFSGMRKLYPLTNDTTAEFFALLISFIVTLFAVMMIGMIPVEVSTKGLTNTLLTSAVENCRPEPLELPQFAAAVLLVPITFLISYSVLKKLLSPVPFMLTNTVQLIVLFVVCVISFFAYYTNRDSTSHFHEAFYLSLFVLVPLTAVCMFILILSQRLGERKYRKILFFSVLAVIFAYAVWRIITIDFSVSTSQYNYHHYYAIWYPIVRVNEGQTIGTDFKCIYGFYPYIAVPFLKLFGGVNQTSSSVFITLLLTVTAAAYCAFAYRFIKNKILALLTAAVCALYGPFSVLGDRADGGVKLYLQYNPLRSVCIAAALFAVLIRSRIKSKRAGIICDIAVCLILGLCIVWNFETGAVAVIIWSAYRVFDSALENNLLSKKTFIGLLKALAYAAVSFAEFFAVVSLITYLRSGQLLSLKEMLFGITTFAGTGVYMMKLQFGIWVISAIVFAAALIKVIPYLTKNKAVPDKMKSTITGLFVSSVTGIGIFSYFIGRSHASNSLFVLPCAVLCCALLYEYNLSMTEAEDYNYAKSTKIVNFVKRVMCAGFIAAVLIPAAGNLAYSFSGDFEKSHHPSGKTLAALNMREDGIKKWADENNNGKIPNNLLDYSVFTDAKLGKKSCENVYDQVDWFYIDNARTYIDFIKAHPSESFMINKYAVYLLSTDLKEEYNDAFKNFKKAKTIKDDFIEEIYIYVPKTS